MDYQYSFSDSLVSQWRWTERYPAAQEIVAYLNYVTDTFDKGGVVRWLVVNDPGQARSNDEYRAALAAL